MVALRLQVENKSDLQWVKDAIYYHRSLFFFCPKFNVCVVRSEVSLFDAICMFAMPFRVSG